MANLPAYAATPGSEIAAIAATANTARDGSGTVATILTAGSGGTRVERIKFKATGTTTAGMLRLYADNGTIKTLLEEIPVSAITPSATIETWEGEILFGDAEPLVLPTGWTLKAAPHNAEAFVALVVAGDF